MRVHAIKTGNVLVKSAFLHSPATEGGTLPYLAHVFVDRSRVALPIMAWVIEHPEGVIVVDTGENAATGGNFITQSRFEISPEEEIGAQLKRLGIAPRDVAKVVLTHLHGDHMDGLKDFPGVPIWLSRREFQPFLSPSGGRMQRLGIKLPAGFAPTLIDFRPDPLGPFSQSFPLTRDGKVVAVPTPGHTAGHLSVIVIGDDVDLFLAGDVTYQERSLPQQVLEGPSMEIALHRQTLAQVHEYARRRPTVYLPAHDPESARRLGDRQVVSVDPAKVLADARG